MAADVPSAGSRDPAARDAYPPAADRRDLVDVMRELATLRDEGLLSEAEYEKARRMAVEARRPPTEQQ